MTDIKVFRKLKTVYLVLDNTPRDNKNNYILRYFIKLRALKVFEDIYIAFPIKGHTHGALDALGGQAVVKCSNAVFDTDRQLCRVYQSCLNNACFEEGTFCADCYKQDNAANWRSWVEDIELDFSRLTGPAAPHGFRIVARCQLGDVRDATLTSCQDAPPPHPDDLVLAVHKFMSDKEPYQVCLLVPGRQIEQLKMKMSLQPCGNHARKHMKSEDREEISRKAKNCFEKDGISQEAFDFLVGWAQGTNRRDARPDEYSLSHRYDREQVSTNAANIRYLQNQARCLRQVVVLQQDMTEPGPAATW